MEAEAEAGGLPAAAEKVEAEAEAGGLPAAAEVPAAVKGLEMPADGPARLETRRVEGGRTMRPASERGPGHEQRRLDSLESGTPLWCGVARAQRASGLQCDSIQ